MLSPYLTWYGSVWGDWCPHRVRGMYGVSLKTIRAGWDQSVHFVSYKLGDGTQIKFWHDSWCWGHPPWERVLSKIARDVEALVADHFIFKGKTHNWDINFTSTIHDWELESVANFMDLINSSVINQSGMDEICWNPSPRSMFEVKSYYRLLHSSTWLSFPWKSLWRQKSRHFFCWTEAMGKIITVDDLRKRRILVIDWCCMCKLAWEIINHFASSFPCCLWAMEYIFTLFGVVWVMPERVEDLLDSWNQRLGETRSHDFGCDSPLSHVVPMVWDAWTFKGRVKSMHDLKFLHLKSLFEWMNASSLFSFDNIFEILDTCSFGS